jgi:P4 family phage/plasmid primase-like protien
MVTPAEIRTWLEREAEIGCRALNALSTQRVVGETRAWITRNPDIFVPEVEWDNHGGIPTKTGIVDPFTKLITPIRKEHYVTVRVEADYDADATAPRWTEMLNDVFVGDAEMISSFQEVAGAMLVDNRPKSLTRALVLVGPSNSGKSNLIEVIGGMFSEKPNTTTFDMLENPHGLMEFLRRAPWVIHEAFDQNKWHFSATTKALLSGDPVNVNVKNGPIMTCRFHSPVIWGTNAPPQFRESTKAMENRIKIFHCKREFDADAPVGVAAAALRKGYTSPAELILTEERSGVLNWMIEGYKRAAERGKFVDTVEMGEALHDMRVEGNIVAGFLEDAVTFNPDKMVSRADFYAGFSAWWEENRGDANFKPSPDAVGRALSAMYDPRIGVHKTLFKINSHRYYVGICLNDLGLDMWNAKFNAEAVKGGAARMSAGDNEVNKDVPEKWATLDVVKKIRDAQGKRTKV